MPFRFLGIQGNIAQLGPIQGIFGTRNLLGFVAVLALITFLIEYRTQSVRAGVSVVLGRARGRPRGAQRLPHRARPRRRASALAVGALALVRHARPEGRSALQWTLGGLVVVGLAIGYAARHPIIALLGAGIGLLDAGEPLEHDGRLSCASEPVQGWGWFGPWNQREFPFSAINYHAAHASTRPG